MLVEGVGGEVGVGCVVVSVLIVFRASLMCLAEGVHFLLQGLEVGIKNGEFYFG